MTDYPQDDARLRATEAQMRRALGLGTSATPRPQAPQQTQAHAGFHRPQRQFARDGDVPVTVIHRDEPAGTNQLEAARQTIRTLTSAREVADRRLSEALVTIQQLRTQLAHERLAKDEAVAGIENARQTAEQALAAARDELATVHSARLEAETRLAEALELRQGAERQNAVEVPSQAPLAPRKRGRPKKNASIVQDLPRDPTPEETSDVPPVTIRQSRGKTSQQKEVTQPPAAEPAQPRRRGRPPRVKEPESEYVEWWKPNWRKKYQK